MENLINSALIGAILSVFFQFLKTEINPKWRATCIIVLSIICGVGYYFLAQNPNLLETIITIVGTASTVYALLIRNFQKIIE